MPSHSDSETKRSIAPNADKLLHTSSRFEFEVKAPIELVAPLFGAEKERSWSPGWDPVFLWPSNAHDREGMIFKVAHGHNSAIWLNTIFDTVMGRIQYVYILPDTLVTLINIKMRKQEGSTCVSVEYDRTSLNQVANDTVHQMAEHDASLGSVWERRINEYLDKMSGKQT